MFWRVPQTLFGKLACESLPYAMQIALLKALCFRHKRTKLGFWNPSNYIRWLLLRRLSQFFSINCYAALDLGSGVGQPFNRLIVQNRQQSIKRSMDWTLDDSFFYAMLTGRRRDHTPLGQAGLEASDTGTEAVKPDPGCSWECHSMKVGAGDESSEYREVVQPPRLPLVIRPVCRTYVVVVRWNYELLWGEHKWCLDLRRRAFAARGQVNAKWSRCPNSIERHVRETGLQTEWWNLTS